MSKYILVDEGEGNVTVMYSDSKDPAWENIPRGEAIEHIAGELAVCACSQAYLRTVELETGRPLGTYTHESDCPELDAVCSVCFLSLSHEEVGAHEDCVLE